jgi:hypothetical protein
MGTAGNRETTNQGQQGDGDRIQNAQQSGQQGQGIGSPITNDAYNVVSALHSKLEGLEAYRKYSKDASSQLWQQLTKVEIEAVGKLVDELERLVKDGKLRMREPGVGKANG